jgi:hypothetical protein
MAWRKAAKKWESENTAAAIGWRKYVSVMAGGGEKRNGVIRWAMAAKENIS